MNIQWFPGHMQKARKIIEDNLKMVDIVIEIVDARIPNASRNPLLDSLLGNKKRVLVLNKADIADPKVNKLWIDFLNQKSIPAILTNSKQGFDAKPFFRLIEENLKEKIQKMQEKGLKKPIRMMVAGVPNSGKSSFINRLSKRSALKAEDRPGVTKAKQWITVSNGFELLDTPGILWPKFENESVSLKLAFTGAIKDDIMDIEQLAYNLLDFLKQEYSPYLNERYHTDISKEDETLQIMEQIAKNRGCVISGGEYDFERISRIILDEFRNAKIGRITLEKPIKEGNEEG